MGSEGHVTREVPDYVLGLLPRAGRQRVERHAASCLECRQRIGEEVGLAELVHSTLQTVQTSARPAPERLRALMPPIPKQRSPRLGLAWSRQLAPAALLLLLLLGSWGIWRSAQRPLWSGTGPTYLTATIAITDAPTATLSETKASQSSGPVPTAVAVSATSLVTGMAPTPERTPGATLSPTSPTR